MTARFSKGEPWLSVVTTILALERGLPHSNPLRRDGHSGDGLYGGSDGGLSGGAGLYCELGMHRW